MTSEQQQAATDVEVGEATPLLQNEGTPQPPAPVLQDLKAESLKEKAVSGVALVSFVTSLLSIAFHSALHPTVWISSLLGLVIAPTAAFQQHKLTQVEALEQTNVVFEREAEKLAQENTKLQETVQQMEESVLNLEAMEQTLQTLQAVEGQSVTTLEQQVEDSKQILRQLRGNHAGKVLQNFLTIVFQVNRDDQDMVLDDDNIDEIIARLEGLHGIDVKDDLLRKVIIEQGRSIEAVMQIAKNIIEGTSSAENSNSTGGSTNKQDANATSIFTFLQNEDDVGEDDYDDADDAAEDP